MPWKEKGGEWSPLLVGGIKSSMKIRLSSHACCPSFRWLILEYHSLLKHMTPLTSPWFSPWILLGMSHIARRQREYHLCLRSHRLKRPRSTSVALMPFPLNVEDFGKMWRLEKGVAYYEQMIGKWMPCSVWCFYLPQWWPSGRAGVHLMRRGRKSWKPSGSL